MNTHITIPILEKHYQERNSAKIQEYVYILDTYIANDCWGERSMMKELYEEVKREVKKVVPESNDKVYEEQASGNQGEGE